MVKVLWALLVLTQSSFILSKISSYRFSKLDFAVNKKSFSIKSGDFSFIESKSHSIEGSYFYFGFSLKDSLFNLTVNEDDLKTLSTYGGSASLEDQTMKIKFPFDALDIIRKDNKEDTTCGMGDDIEDTYQIDLYFKSKLPNPGKHHKLTFMLEFDLEIQDPVQKTYSEMIDLCINDAGKGFLE